VDFAAAGKGHEFVCAAGVLAHYLGDACQPLHISYLHDGDPSRPVEHKVTRGDHAGELHREALGKGIHSLYEDTMVHLHRRDILAALARTPAPQSIDDVQDGFEAARKTLDMMRKTIAAIPPLGLVNAYVDFGHGGQAGAEVLWNQFGNATIQVMQDGTHLLAALWESAWRLGDGETNVKSVEQLTHHQAMAIVQREGFLPSRTIDQIGTLLKVHS
jgi:hypothetical protein